MNEDNADTRQERREQKLESQRARMRKHGKNLARIYKEAILKRINKLRREKRKGERG